MVRKSRLLLFLGLGTVAALANAAPVSVEPFSADALRAIDPSQRLLQLCGGNRERGAALRQRVQLALVEKPAADTIAAPRLISGLEIAPYRISTANALAQRYFDQGLALLYGFNHHEAIRYFRAAQRLDPACAMCWWGEAFAHGPNINAPMEPEANRDAVAAARRAVLLQDGASAAEQALIAAMATRYSTAATADRAALDRDYAGQMLLVAEKFPADDTIAVLAAEAVMDTRPWDYWEADGQTPKGDIGTAVMLVEKVLARNLDHPQAIHLYIHLVEASNTPERAEPFADRLAKPLVPAAGYLVHMPGHIYYRLGRFRDAMRVNVAAARVDEEYLRDSGEAGLYRFGYYPHNVHFLVSSAQMAGDMQLAIAEARKLATILNTDISAAMPWVQPVDAAPYLAHAQFAAPDEILALAPPDVRLPYVMGMWHYARAVAYAGLRDDKGAAREIAAIGRIRETTDFKPMTDRLVPAPELLRLAETVARGRLAFAHGRYDEAAALYGDAIRIEDGIGYMEPPFWYYPVRQSLGAALYRAGDHKAAHQAFMEALAQAPNNGWALYGLRETQTALGDKAGAAASTAALRKAWAGDVAWLRMERL